jgi:Na+:H+ antiporter, NhaA family
MAIFFLLIGLELERELYTGELSNLRDTLLPIAAAIGGMIVPTLIHLSLNAGTPTQSGFGIRWQQILRLPLASSPFSETVFPRR